MCGSVYQCVCWDGFLAGWPSWRLFRTGDICEVSRLCGSSCVCPGWSAEGTCSYTAHTETSSSLLTHNNDRHTPRIQLQCLNHHQGWGSVLIPLRNPVLSSIKLHQYNAFMAQTEYGEVSTSSVILGLFTLRVLALECFKQYPFVCPIVFVIAQIRNSNNIMIKCAKYYSNTYILWVLLRCRNHNIISVSSRCYVILYWTYNSSS